MTTALCAAGQLLMGRGNPQGGSQRWRFVYSVISTCRNTAARAVSTVPTFTRHPTVSTYVAHTSNDAIDVIDIARDQYIESMPGHTAVAGEHGVDLRLGVGVQEITGDGHRATGVQLADGTRIDADAVLVGVGATPNTGLAEQAGLTVDNGIIVDAALRSSNPDVYAAGDVARAYHPLLQTHIRVEHWANALN